MPFVTTQATCCSIGSMLQGIWAFTLGLAFHSFVGPSAFRSLALRAVFAIPFRFATTLAPTVSMYHKTRPRVGRRNCNVRPETTSTRDLVQHVSGLLVSNIRCVQLLDAAALYVSSVSASQRTQSLFPAVWLGPLQRMRSIGSRTEIPCASYKWSSFNGQVSSSQYSCTQPPLLLPLGLLLPEREKLQRACRLNFLEVP